MGLKDFIGKDGKPKIRLLDNRESFITWIEASEAQELVSDGSHDEVHHFTRTRRQGITKDFFGIKPTSTPKPASNINSAASITFGEMEVNAGLYPGTRLLRDTAVSPAHYKSVRQKIADWPTCGDTKAIRVRPRLASDNA